MSDTYLRLSFDQLNWTQSLHSKGETCVFLSGRLSRRNYLIPGEQQLVGALIELKIMRGRFACVSPSAPTDCVGFVQYYPEESKDVPRPTYFAGECSLPDDIYDDLWHRLTITSQTSATIDIRVGPLDFASLIDYSWERHVREALFITEVELQFVRNETARPQ